MTQLFKQFVYCNNESLKNLPSSLLDTELISGSAFQDYTPLVQLGIQAPPGTKFYINGSSNPVIVGSNGLFDIDLTQGGSIMHLAFDSSSINWIKSNDSAILIVDVAYVRGN